ncbi:hypothetical protein [Aureimonas leprariae]|uniref:Uncharacterized protein n=1 Tax=Plantimonas leprariae TaxID=2615207 RepID=A0A7V7PTR0_9HYPH|nr:hypothetical protein [Aureimonas leprariae]KAB0682979.1 hypothetical protein F6X38_02570 [Aureimonas leprariae]
MYRADFNEARSPVPLEILALLLRSDEAKVAETVLALPEAQRAALALYCFGRCHMRSLGLEVGRHCSERSLESVGGSAGLILSRQAQSAEPFDVGSSQPQKRRISLARFAA